MYTCTLSAPQTPMASTSPSLFIAGTPQFVVGIGAHKVWGERVDARSLWAAYMCVQAPCRPTEGRICNGMHSATAARAAANCNGMPPLCVVTGSVGAAYKSQPISTSHQNCASCRGRCSPRLASIPNRTHVELSIDTPCHGVPKPRMVCGPSLTIEPMLWILASYVVWPSCRS